MFNSTLILNADGTPTSLVPISSASWQDSVTFLWTDHAEVLHYYDDWFVHSPTITLQVPAVCILKRQVATTRRVLRTEHGGPPSRLVFLRDASTCQYCGKTFPINKLTLDHVIPRKHGGKTRWDNITTACEPCNSSRGHDVRIQPMTKPFRPTYHHLVKMRRRFPLTIPHPSWSYYLGWSEKLLRVVHPNKVVFTSEESFDFM